MQDDPTSSQVTAHIVYLTTDRMWLDKGPYGEWREIQDAYPSYMASLGPWTESQILEFFCYDWGADESRWPFSRAAIKEFFRSSARVLGA